MADLLGPDFEMLRRVGVDSLLAAAVDLAERGRPLVCWLVALQVRGTQPQGRGLDWTLVDSTHDVVIPPLH